MTRSEFDQAIDRRNTASLKWDRYGNRDVIPMWVADMDFASPPAVQDALRRRVDHGVFGYTHAPRDLIEAVVAMLKQRYGWSVKPEWLVWLPGIVPGLNLACHCAGEPGTGVAVPVPIYPPFLQAPSHSDRRAVHFALERAGRRWEIDTDQFDQALSKSSLLLFCHPHNPTGRTFAREDLEQLTDRCLKHGVIICSDEIHCGLYLDRKPHVPLASIDDEVARHTITLMAPSKTFNIPGLGLGFAVIPDRTLRQRFTAAKKGLVPYPNALAYTACTAAYRYGDPWRRDLVDYLRENARLVERTVQDGLAPLDMGHVEATCLAWIDARSLKDPELAPCRFFEKHGVGLSDGTHFGAEGFVRLNFGCPRSRLQAALDRLVAAVSA